MELVSIGIACAAAIIALAACWISARSAPAQVLTSLDDCVAQLRRGNIRQDDLEAAWTRKCLEIDGLVEELFGQYEKVERSRKSIAARQSKQNAQQEQAPQTPEEVKHALLQQARNQGLPL